MQIIRFLTLAAVLGVAGQGGASRAQVEAPFPEPPADLPAQQRYRDWPTPELQERPYWYPWSWASFQSARLFGRPVLFALAPRWNRATQRMMDGPLQEPAVLRLANEGYVSVLASPDRRPDIRERYLTGVWPVVAFLLPDGLPLLSDANPRGVVEPITTAYVNADAMRFMLEEGTKYWQRRGSSLVVAGQEWARSEAPDLPRPGSLEVQVSDELAAWLMSSADRRDGGFGRAPKFVLPAFYEYGAVRRARLAPAVALHARFSLERMLTSPLWDGERGGAHRIAGAPDWGQIQYEKLLEPNAALLRDLVFAYRGSGVEAFRAGVSGVADFLVEQLGRPGGGFHLARWADPLSADGGGFWRGDHDQPPPIDPLVLAGPNAAAGAALIRAGILLERQDWIDAGRAALDLVLERAYQAGRGLNHVIEPNPESLKLLWPQADGALALVDAFETTGDARYLDAAEGIVEFAWANLKANQPLLQDRLSQPLDLGLLKNPRFPVRPNVRLARALMRLAWHGRGTASRERANTILGGLAGSVAAFRTQGIEAALAVEEWLAAPLIVRIHGEPEQADVEALRRAAANVAFPWTIVAAGDPGRAPGAVLAFDGRTEQTAAPEALAAAANRLTGWLESAGR